MSTEYHDRWENGMLGGKHRQRRGKMRWWEWILAVVLVAVIVIVQEPLWNLIQP